MLWFVNPYDDTQAINLDLVRLIKLTTDKQRCAVKFDVIVWNFSSRAQASEVYETVIRLGQKGRYHE